MRGHGSKSRGNVCKAAKNTQLSTPERRCNALFMAACVNRTGIGQILTAYTPLSLHSCTLKVRARRDHVCNLTHAAFIASRPHQWRKAEQAEVLPSGAMSS